MANGEAIFVSFCAEIARFCNFGHCANYELAKAASYFWNRFTDYEKQQWKFAAAHYSADNGLTGKKKRRGFWHFAIYFQQQMLGMEVDVYSEIWRALRPEHQAVWAYPDCYVIDHEMGSITSGIDNLLL